MQCRKGLKTFLLLSTIGHCGGEAIRSIRMSRGQTSLTQFVKCLPTSSPTNQGMSPPSSAQHVLQLQPDKIKSLKIKRLTKWLLTWDLMEPKMMLKSKSIRVEIEFAVHPPSCHISFHLGIWPIRKMQNGYYQGFTI